MATAKVRQITAIFLIDIYRASCHELSFKQRIISLSNMIRFPWRKDEEILSAMLMYSAKKENRKHLRFSNVIT